MSESGAWLPVAKVVATEFEPHERNPDRIEVLETLCASLAARLTTAEQTIARLGPCPRSPYGTYGHGWDMPGAGKACGYCGLEVAR